jgi:zinc/manganese transport system substrate-binding protein
MSLCHPGPIPAARRRPAIPKRIAAVVMGAALLLTPGTPGPLLAASEPPNGQPSVVVTTSILGAVVRDLVGDRASVSVLMGNGVDPHDWAPSAQDLESIYAADLVVANGLDLEEGLHDALATAQADGVPVFHATDHITVRGVAETGDEHAGDAHADDAHADDAHADDDAAPSDDAHVEDGDHVHGAADPHFWVDPVSMAGVVEALGPVLGELGIDVASQQADLVARLMSLDAEVRELLAVVPLDARRLVTGHESMGYFAERYGFEMVGTVIPSLSTQGEVSARAMADLAAAIREAGVSVIFAEVGTPQAVTEAIAGETGARVVELGTHLLPEDGSYASFISGIAAAIAEALS